MKGLEIMEEKREVRPELWSRFLGWGLVAYFVSFVVVHVTFALTI